MGDRVDKVYPVFVAGSEDPSRVMSWDQWREKWRATRS